MTNDRTLNYDAENRLVSVSGAATANFTYDGDGKQIKATVNGTTTVYVGNHYEVKNSVVTKYYFAGTTRLAVRTDGTLSYLLGDHLGSSSVTTDANGAKTASALYKAFGETRYTLGNLSTDYKFTGQREEASLGIYFFNARWYDSSLGRFLSPDTIVPTSTQGTQAWDRYAFVNNNPVRYTDPTGHMIDQGDGGGPNTCNDPTYCENGKPKEYNSVTDQTTSAVNSNCIENLSSCYGLDAIMWGANISGSEPSWFKTAGLEELVMLDDGTRATFEYVGEGSAAGAGASLSAYGGVVFNLDDPDSYLGPFGSVGITFSIGEVGITAFYFWDSSKPPLSSGTTQGFAVGYAPGAQLSAWGAGTVYTETWRSDR